MMKNVIQNFVLVSIILFSLAAIQTNAQSKPAGISSALPDVVGIRPGMPAQEAYNLLKARSPNIKIGIGQLDVPGLGPKPTVVQMSAQVFEGPAPEIISLWLTIPPGPQLVFAVGRILDYDQNKALLKTTVLENLRQKYGAETDSGPVATYWAFDEQGKRPNAAQMRQQNCMSLGHGSLFVAAPPGTTFSGSTTVLFHPEAATPCDSFIRVLAHFEHGPDLDPTEVTHISVMIWDLALERRTEEAYQAYLLNGDDAKRKAELEKAKQRKGPDF